MQIANFWQLPNIVRTTINCRNSSPCRKYKIIAPSWPHKPMKKESRPILTLIIKPHHTTQMLNQTDILLRCSIKQTSTWYTMPIFYKHTIKIQDLTQVKGSYSQTGIISVLLINLCMQTRRGSDVKPQQDNIDDCYGVYFQQQSERNFIT